MFVLEWSKKQNSFHLHEAKACIESNLSAFIGNETRDYIPVMIGSRDDCEFILNKYRHRLMEREPKRFNRNVKNMLEGLS